MNSLNSLFNKKTIKELVKDIEITDKQKKSSKEWLKLLENNKLQDEKSNYPKFMSIILDDILGYPIKDIDFEIKNMDFSFSNKNDKKILCFEVKGTGTKDLHAIQHRNKKEHSTPIKQTWDYMGSLGLEYGICTNYKEFILITKEHGYSKEYIFDFESIRKNDEYLKEFIGIFSKNRVIESGFIEKLHIESVNVEREFTDEFYKLYHETRLMLKMSFEENGNVGNNEAIYYTQIILNRLIFMFFVEDRGFISDSKLFRNRILNILDQGQLTEHSKKVFDDIKELFISFDKGSDILGVFGFNGGLFSGVLPDKIFFNDIKDSSFYDEVKQHSKLLKSTKLNLDESGKIKKHTSLNPIISNLLIMDSFDFNTDVNVNILGHIFEQSISDLEELKNQTELKRKKEGVYYTPEYITDYICRNTIIPYLSKTGTNDITILLDEYEKDIEILETKFKDIKILDLSCGSGAFLIKAIDILMQINKEIKLKKYTGSYSYEQKQITSNFDEESEIRFIVENNIYGVDLNPESVEITQLSIFLKIASNTRKLIGLSQRIQSGNSVISDSEIDSRAFNWNGNFAEILDPMIKDRGFDVIIGNPPYVRQETLDHKEKMILPDNHTLDLPEKYTIDSKSDLSCYFHYHALNLLKKGGVLGFISSDSWLHFGYGFGVQKLFLDNSDISEITKINFNVFEDADISTAIILLRKLQTKNHKALFKTVNKGGFESENFTINKKPQNELIPDNWNNYFSEFDFMPKIEMVKMYDLGFIKRGKTTGYNDFFVLTKDVIEKYGISDEFITPIISNDIHFGLLTTDDIKLYLLNVNDSKGKLVKTQNGKNILKYIEYAEKTKIISKRGKNQKPCLISELSTVKNRKMWYSLDLLDYPKIFLSQIIYKQVKIYENNDNFYALDVFCCFTPFNESHTHSFLAFFASSFYSYYLEIMGHGMGGGALKFQIIDYKKSIVPNFDKLTKSQLSKMSKAWLDYREDFNKQKLDNIVFQILGFNENEKKMILEKLESKINTRINRKK